MNENIQKVFEVLSTNNIGYYLLRPIHSNSTPKDIDLIISIKEQKKLLKTLDEKKIPYRIHRSGALSSRQIEVFSILLDVKSTICFLPYKTLTLDSLPPLSKIKFEQNLIFPDTSDEVLFTLWTLHNFLDKKTPDQSSSFTEYRARFGQTWSSLISSSYFLELSKKIFLNSDSLARGNMASFFENGFSWPAGKSNPDLMKMTLNAHSGLKIQFLINRVRFGIGRRLGIYGSSISAK